MRGVFNKFFIFKELNDEVFLINGVIIVFIGNYGVVIVRRSFLIWLILIFNKLLLFDGENLYLYEE